MLLRIRYTATFLVLLGAILLPSLLDEYHVAISAFLILFLGVPHGAGDHVIFRHLGREFLGARSVRKFIILYLALAGAFLLIWTMAPMRALLLFLLISIYHFGQEHFAYLQRKDWKASMSYVAWGAFVLFFPLIVHFDETSAFVESLTGVGLSSLSNQVQGFLLVLLPGLLVFCIGWLHLAGTLNRNQMFREFAHVAGLVVMFALVPLLLGFAVFFVFWHSLGAMQHQLQFFKKHVRDFKMSKFLFQILAPASVIIVIALIAILTLETSSIYQQMGYLFVIIAMITLPHVLLFDRFYHQMEELPSEVSYD